MFIKLDLHRGTINAGLLSNPNELIRVTVTVSDWRSLYPGPEPVLVMDTEATGRRRWAQIALPGSWPNSDQQPPICLFRACLGMLQYGIRPTDSESGTAIVSTSSCLWLMLAATANWAVPSTTSPPVDKFQHQMEFQLIS